jgi:hypothetical protein
MKMCCGRLQRGLVTDNHIFVCAMPSLAPTCSREAVTRNRERGHVLLRESMPPSDLIVTAH